MYWQREQSRPQTNLRLRTACKAATSFMCGSAHDPGGAHMRAHVCRRMHVYVLVYACMYIHTWPQLRIYDGAYVCVHAPTFIHRLCAHITLQTCLYARCAYVHVCTHMCIQSHLGHAVARRSNASRHGGAQLVRRRSPHDRIARRCALPQRGFRRGLGAVAAPTGEAGVAGLGRRTRGPPAAMAARALAGLCHRRLRYTATQRSLAPEASREHRTLGLAELYLGGLAADVVSEALCVLGAVVVSIHTMRPHRRR